jgi:hypothetical protein
MDQGDDRDHLRQQLQERELTPVMPPKRHRKAPISDEAAHDQRREQVERFFNRLTQFRRMATRYEKLRQTSLACIDIVALWVMIQSFVNTPSNNLGALFAKSWRLLRTVRQPWPTLKAQER